MARDPQNNVGAAATATRRSARTRSATSIPALPARGWRAKRQAQPGGGYITTLCLPGALRDQLERRGREGYPNETCGLLLGHATGERVEVKETAIARNLNVERAADRYELDPADFVAADARARAAGMEIVGIWHSHPDHPAQPSPTDLTAAWEGWSYVILSVSRAGLEDLRSWRLDGGRFVEEEVAA